LSLCLLNVTYLNIYVLNIALMIPIKEYTIEIEFKLSNNSPFNRFESCKKV